MHCLKYRRILTGSKQYWSGTIIVDLLFDSVYVRIYLNKFIRLIVGNMTVVYGIVGTNVTKLSSEILIVKIAFYSRVLLPAFTSIKTIIVTRATRCFNAYRNNRRAEKSLSMIFGEII